MEQAIYQLLPSTKTPANRADSGTTEDECIAPTTQRARGNADDNDGNDEEDEEVPERVVIRSRDKGDYWHELYNVSFPKDCPASPFIFKLLH